MPIPDTPYTRREAYLNAIATGDSGGIPETPYTREEMYLDAIARNGGGGGGGGGSSTLSGLTDVDISNPSNGQTLVYNAISGKWENGSGCGCLVVTLDDDNDYQADKTCLEIYNAMEQGSVIFRKKYVETLNDPDTHEEYTSTDIVYYSFASAFIERGQDWVSYEFGIREGTASAIYIRGSSDDAYPSASGGGGGGDEEAYPSASGGGGGGDEEA